MKQSLFILLPCTLLFCPLFFAAKGQAKVEAGPDKTEPLLMAGSAAAPTDTDLLALYLGDDRLVETSTRYPKPITEIAENITVITARDIEQMNVNSLHDVLSHVAGLFVDRQPPEASGVTNLYLQASRPEHTVVFLDGVRRNSAAAGNYQFNSIPIQIIDRIEIIKGPASSAWGSSLGGVINIFTKKTGSTPAPMGTVTASIGEAETQTYDGDVAGKAAGIGYYLYAGRRDSDGLRFDRFQESDMFYGKAGCTLPDNSALTATFGYSDLYFDIGDFTRNDFSAEQIDRETFLTLNINKDFSKTLNLNMGLRKYGRDFTQPWYILGLGFRYPGAAPGESLWSTSWEEQSSGANLHLTWKLESHTLGLGAEINRHLLDKHTDYGNYVQTAWALPARDVAHTVSEEVYGIYFNDTFHIKKFTITPGIRYDHHSRADDLVNPSLGIVYRLNKETLFRAFVARGFLHPLFSYLAIQDLFQVAQPHLKPEKAITYQLGVETTALQYLRLKLTLFQHDIKDNWLLDSNSIWANIGKTRRQGFEAELETIAWHDVSLTANVTYVHEDPRFGAANDSSTAANLIFRYDDAKSITAELQGYYVWWNELYAVDGGGGEYDDPVWNLRLSKKLALHERIGTDIFCRINNIFSAPQYADKNYKNPDRWVEAGIRMSF